MSATPKLSKGFFQAFFAEKLPPGAKPLLQVLEARPINKQPQQAPATYRVRLSDSLHSYSGCGVANVLTQRFLEDGLDKHNGIIRVTEFTRNNTGTKITMTVVDYELISLDFPVIGNPTAHSGKAEDYKSIENFNVENLNPGRTALKREGDDDYGRQPLSKRQPSSNTGNTTGLTAISLITPFINKWRICGVVSGKENIREVNKGKGPMSVFSFVVTDQSENSIKVSAFNVPAEKFHPIITNGQVYYISGSGQSSVRPAQKRWNNTSHDYELILSNDSEVTLATDTQISEPKFRLNPVPLGKISEHIEGLIDVLAIIDRAAELGQVTRRGDGTQLDKRDIYLVDQSGVEVTMTLWDEKARDFDMSNVGKAIGIKGCGVREFNGGFSLSPSRMSVIKFNPEGDATNQLYVWYQEQRPNATLRTISSSMGDSSASFERDLRLIGLVVQHRIGQNEDRGAYINVKGMITAIKTENAVYQACPTENCKKKLVMENNQYRCEKCNATYDNFKNIIMLAVEIADFSGTAWATIFDDKASALLGVSGDQLAQLQKEDASQFEAVFEKIRFKEFNFRVRVKYEIYNDQQQMRCTIYDIKPVPYDRFKRLYEDAVVKCEAMTV